MATNATKQPANIWRLLFFVTITLVILAFGGYYLSKTKPVANLINKTKTTVQGWVNPNKVPKSSVKFNTQEYHNPQKLNLRGLNLVFFSDQYANWDEFNNDSDALITQLKTIEPWKSYNSYNIYKIKPEKTGICYVKVQDERKPALRCNPTDTNDYLANMPLEKFKLIVLSRQEFQSWANISRYENTGIFFSAPKVLKDKSEQKVNALLLAHLLGHGFGLKDEEIYVIAKAGGAPHTPDGPNCAPDVATAKEWWGDLAAKYPEVVGNFKGCAGNKDYIKPTESSIMNLNTGNAVMYSYGPVSEEYLKKVLNYCYSDKSIKYSDDKTFFDRYPEYQACVK